jgi:hypothetical protein
MEGTEDENGNSAGVLQGGEELEVAEQGAEGSETDGG